MVPMMLQLEPTSSGIMHTESKGKGGEEKSGGERVTITTVLPGKRVHFDHCVVSADFTCESCMYSVSILYTIRSMIGLSSCQIMECNELSSGI